jgi:hypothetical protein
VKSSKDNIWQMRIESFYALPWIAAVENLLWLATFLI